MFKLKGNLEQGCLYFARNAAYILQSRMVPTYSYKYMFFCLYKYMFLYCLKLYRGLPSATILVGILYALIAQRSLAERARLFT
jgi:hypothetical protein